MDNWNEDLVTKTRKKETEKNIAWFAFIPQIANCQADKNSSPSACALEQ